MLTQLQTLRGELQRSLSASGGCDNVKRRELHAKVELLRLDLEEEAIKAGATFKLTPIRLVEKLTSSSGSAEKVVPAALKTVEPPSLSEGVRAELDEMVERLTLVPVRRPFRWWYWLDIVFRFVGVCMGFFTVGVFLSLLIIFLRVVDSLLGLGPFDSISERLKRVICKFLLILSGVEVLVEGLNRDAFNESCTLLTFTHASNIDGFLVAYTCPIRHYALAKKELFYVPFFSWISIAIGGVPVDRENRDRAVAALKRTTEAAKRSKMCLVIAPEGTRSLTGQLLPFKKGVSHMWDELKAPIVPMVLFGAWDLYPVGSWVNQCGHVAVRYLKPILPEEIESREQVTRIVRRRILESLLSCPKIIGTDLNWTQRITNVAVTLLNIAFDFYALLVMRNIAFARLGLSLHETLLYSAGAIATVTIGLYLAVTVGVEIVSPVKVKKS